ncbi:MAG TPA: PASTA domain-containing protein [Patescibacteria group bacterium]|nr:PASTA domain-containing protein [Patescibacteria group bacterium]
MILKNYLWLTPFISFILGYCIMQRLFHTPEHITPNLVGKQVHEILPLITQYNLNIRLINHKEETDLPEGIILNQTPAAGTTIKSNQPLYVVITKKPLAARAPHCIGININQLTEILHTTNINPRIYYMPHSYPENMCFAQLPQPDESLEKNKLILYVSSGNNKPIIWPDFTDISLSHVIEFLNNYDIEPQIINDFTHKNCDNSEYIVKDQRPLAGTLLTLDKNKPLSVQLRVH